MNPIGSAGRNARVTRAPIHGYTLDDQLCLSVPELQASEPPAPRARLSESAVLC